MISNKVGALALRRATAVAAAVITASATVGAVAQAAPAPAPAPATQETTSTTAAKAKPADQVRAPVPKITWGPCPATWGSDAAAKAEKTRQITFDCGTAKVPLDYDKPNGPKINLALRRVAAKEQHNKIGTLFVNPGGPGGSGVQFMDSAWSLYSPWVLDKFDVVGFDPRGVGLSNPLVCWTSPQEMEAANAGSDPFFPANDKQYVASARASKALSSACARNAGPIINHMGTGNVARDLDLLRQAVGDQKLTFNGISYGTQIGQTYAAMYPNRVRAIVLDAVIDPKKYSSPSSTLGLFPKFNSDVATHETFQQFLTLCAKSDAKWCPLNQLGKPSDVVAKTAAQLKKKPVTITVDGRQILINYQVYVIVLVQATYAPAGWSEVSAVLADIAVASGAVPAPPGRPTAGLSASSKGTLAGLTQAPMPQTSEGLIGVACVDSKNPQSLKTLYRVGQRRDQTVAPYFGLMRQWQTAPCAGWPGKDTDRFTGPYETTTSNPVLVVGVKHDPATEYAGAVAARKNIKNSVLLTYDGWGHPAIGQNVCTDNAISNYLLAGTLPKDGTVCSPKGSPFDRAAAHAAMGPVSSATKAARVKAYKSLARIDQGYSH